MNVLIDNITAHYRDEGKGPVFLMLHGWGSDLTTFNNLVSELQSDFRVIRLDLPGFGRTPFLSEQGWDLNDYVEFINKFLKKIDVKKIDGLLGHSLGGRLAIKAVSQKALTPQKLILMASHGVREKQGRNLAWKLVAKLGKLTTVILPSRAKNSLKAKLYKAAGSQDYLMASGAMKQTFKNILEEDLLVSAEKIKAQTLLIYGSDDQETPARYGAMFAQKISGSRLEILEGGGHYIHLDHPKTIVKLIKGFVK